jgi:hypothetical protein
MCPDLAARPRAVPVVYLLITGNAPRMRHRAAGGRQIVATRQPHIAPMPVAAIAASS